MRFPRPFFRASKNAWYGQLGKRQVSLGRDREAAFVRSASSFLKRLAKRQSP